MRYDLSETTLRSLDLYTPGAVADPLASNIVNLKAQYGIDTDGDGVLDTWVGADNASWSPALVLAASVETLARIKAVRVGLIVRSEIYDRELVRGFDWTLFDCAASDKTRCPGRLTGTLPAGWRYRVYETIVPLRNAIWNAAS
jgi:type IV pilus assembly protein PilW